MKTKNKRNYLKQGGITLIALVVTIVVLLILAGVTINALFGQSGIIEKARDAQNKMDEATQNDLDAINGVNEWIGKINGTTGGADNPSTSDLPSTDNTIPYYPDETFTKVDGTDLSNGLVIKDANGNEYVWIEVPKTAEVYPTAGLKITNFTEAEYTAIEADLHTYTDYYRNGTSFTDTYYGDYVTGLTSGEYTELKQKMLKSVYENGGFWIGRYEAGIEKNRTSNSIDLATAPAPLSKPGTVENTVYPYVYVSCSNAQTLASKLSTGKSYTSSLMFGVQWDLVLKHIEVKEVAKGTALATIQSALRSDSKDWGNYADASFVINRGKYLQYSGNTWNNYNIALAGSVKFENETSIKVSVSRVGNAILLTTGASDACQRMNIYDLAGNAIEWTLDCTGDSTLPCIGRGGTCIDNGSKQPASARNGGFFNTSAYYNNGFRVSLLK